MKMWERCAWAGTDPLYCEYHDTEWGRPEFDGNRLFEMLVLEGFQSGLSWITILRKRDGFRRVFMGFDPAKLAEWGEAEVMAALADAGIVRHRGKIEATVKNARAFIGLGGAEALSDFLWSSVNHVPFQRNASNLKEIPSKNEASIDLAKRLKRAGFGFCGPTTVYAFMQASGMINDHVVTCNCHSEVSALGASL
jgi:DNA-3-methyladenine glycosylase I